MDIPAKICSNSITETLEKGLELYSKLKIKTELRYLRRSDIFIVKFENTFF